MKKLYYLLKSNFLARYISLLTLSITIITLFGNISLKEFPNIKFFIEVGLVFLSPLIIDILFEILLAKVHKSNSDTSDVSNILTHRMGSNLSLKTSNKIEYDHTHQYDLLYRQDQINFETSDYNSFRQIKGRNVSKNISSYLIYTESTDIPVAFKDITINAINNTNNKSLVVECLHSTTDKRMQHIFKINFDEPIHPNQTFDISFSLTIPNELSVYDPDKEIQSISLVRIKNPVGKLVFNICLNFQPRVAKVFSNNTRNGLNEISGAKIELYRPSNNLQNFYQVNWNGHAPYIIKTEIFNPKEDQYIIMFIK